jgi:hypothetical protein
MGAALKEAQSLIGALGTYARLTIVGVWFPGFLVFCEIGYMALRFFDRTASSPVDYVRSQIKDLDSNAIITLVLILVVSASVLLGYIARDIAFSLSDRWLRHKLPPTRTLHDILSHLRTVFGDEKVGEVIAKYPVFKLADQPKTERFLPRSGEAYVREFCKRWLSIKAPDLNTAGMEIEINMVIGLVAPLGLLAVDLYLVVGSWFGIALGCVALLASMFMMYRITWARNIETEQAISNFLFAHWENLATSKKVSSGPRKRAARKTPFL